MNTPEYGKTWSDGDASRAKGKVADMRDSVSAAADEASSVVSHAVDKTKTAVNEGIEAGKHYLAERNVEDIAGDFTGLIKKHPFQSLFAGIGLGLIIGNTLSRR